LSCLKPSSLPSAASEEPQVCPKVLGCHILHIASFMSSSINTAERYPNTAVQRLPSKVLHHTVTNT
jgi:hypothetical protein